MLSKAEKLRVASVFVSLCPLVSPLIIILDVCSPSIAGAFLEDLFTGVEDPEHHYLQDEASR